MKCHVSSRSCSDGKFKVLVCLFACLLACIDVLYQIFLKTAFNGLLTLNEILILVHVGCFGEDDNGAVGIKLEQVDM